MMKILVLLAIVSYALAFSLALPFNKNGKKNEVTPFEVKGFANEFQGEPTEGEDKEGSCQRKTCDYVIHPGNRRPK